MKIRGYGREIYENYDSYGGASNVSKYYLMRDV